MAEGELRAAWHKAEVEKRVGNALRELAGRTCARVEEAAKGNILRNGQIVTGFLYNSLYVVCSGQQRWGTSYETAKALAEARNPKVKMLPKVTPARDQVAVVGVGAPYAIYPELRRSYFAAAVEEVREATFRADAEAAAKEEGLL